MSDNRTSADRLTAMRLFGLVLVALAGCSPPAVESKFAVGETVSVSHPAGHSFKGTVRQHDRQRGYLVAYNDDRLWTTQEEWIWEERLTSDSPRAVERSTRKEFDLAPLYQAMGAAAAAIAMLVLGVMLVVWIISRQKSLPPNLRKP